MESKEHHAVGPPDYRPIDCALLLFTVRGWTIAKVADRYRIDEQRLRRHLAKYAGVAQVVADHAEGVLRDRCVERLEELCRTVGQRGRLDRHPKRSLRETRRWLRAWTRDVVAKLPSPLDYSKH